ncbi:MAG TPA: ATP-binding cassette domain-containing protein [Acidimicrobiales bacterium]
MEKFLNLTASGAMSGAVYSLIATGLVLSYRATGIFNLGYGAVAFTTAFVYYELHTGLGWPVVPAAVVALGAFAPLVGLALDRLIFRRLGRAADSAKLMATVGVLVALPALAKWTVELLVDVAGWTLPLGNDVYVMPGLGPSPKTTWELPGGVIFDSNQLIVLVGAVACAAGLWLVLGHTRLGLTMRAVVDRPDLARLRGIDQGRTSAQAWVLGTFFAGLAGVVGAPVLNSLDPGTYTYVTFVAVAAAVLGALRSVPLAFAGGLAIGVVQNLVAGYATFADGIREFNASVPFVLLLVGLVALGRDRSRRAGSIGEDAPAGLAPASARGPATGLTTGAGARSAAGGRRRPVAPGAVGAALLLVYVFAVADEFWLGLTTRGLAFSLVFLSFVVVTGMGGMVSLAQTAFVTAAALTAGLLVDRYDAPFLVALAGGVAVAVVLGVVVALPALRLGGLSLALATLALAYLGEKVLFSWEWLGNGQSGWALPRPALGPLDLADDRTLAVVLLVLVAMVTLVIRNVDRSPTGRAIVAVRTAEVAAATSGASPPKVKLTLFALSAAIAALGGVLVATVDQRATGTTFPAFLGLVWLAAVVLWGVRRPAGAILAGLTTVLFPALLANGVHWPSWVPDALSWGGTESTQVADVLFGLGAIQMARDPDGILSVLARARRPRLRRTEVDAEPGVGAGAAAGRDRAVDAAGAASTSAAADTARRVVAAEESATAAQVAADEQRLERLGVVAGGRGRPAAGRDGSAGRPAPVVELRGVRAGYGEVTVLYGVDLDLPAGCVTALVGGNGAGKSTLCAVVAGLVPARAGTITLEGEDVTGVPAHVRARRGVVLAPESRGIFPALSVDDNLALRLTADQRDQVYDRFPALAARRGVPAGSLSGGEQQMLTLGPLLAAPPRVLVADEPTLGLAPRVVGELLDVVAELRDAGVTLLLVEEKARAVLDVADHVVFFELGRVLWRGPRAAVDDDHLAAAYLGGAEAPA